MSVPSEFLPKCTCCDHSGRIYKQPGCEPVALCAQHAAEMRFNMGIDLRAEQFDSRGDLPTTANVDAVIADFERQMEGR